MTGPVLRIGRSPARAGALVLRVPIVGWSTRVQVRSVLVTLVAIAAAFAVFTWGLAVGDFPLPLHDVLGALFGGAPDDATFIVRSLRLPRGLTALFVGASFGVSGAIFQRLARNPLASPDIIGITSGAAAAAVFVVVVVKGTTAQVTWAALAGSILSAAAVYLLAYKRGVTGYRLVLVGIGVSAVLESVVSYLLTQARIFDAQRATVWLTGSLNGRGWEHVRPVGWALAVVLPLTVVLARHLRVLELGDDTARGLGSRVELVRGSLIVAAVALAAISTASAGPVGFVALVAPQIARRLVRARSVALLPAAAVGALVMVAADLVGRRALAPTELPVGVITAVVGAPYLLLLLARANRIGSGG